MKRLEPKAAFNANLTTNDTHADWSIIDEMRFLILQDFEKSRRLNELFLHLLSPFVFYTCKKINECSLLSCFQFECKMTHNFCAKERDFKSALELAIKSEIMLDLTDTS